LAYDILATLKMWRMGIFIRHERENTVGHRSSNQS